MENTLENYKNYLIKLNMSNNTVLAYLKAMDQFFYWNKKLNKNNQNIINKNNLIAFKGELIEKYCPKTVNIKILGINKYLSFIKKDNLKLKQVKFQQKTFIDNVISDADYKFLKNKLKSNGKTNYYFMVRFLAATGARVSELIQIKAEHVKKGYIDIYSKGGKVRRIYIPKKLKEESLLWLDKVNIKSGYIFLNKFGERITPRGLSIGLKNFAKEYGMNEKVVYPHSFRHRFAKNFLEKCSDIALLADLMGHDSIETTRIYLRKTSTEQQEIVDKIVTW